jgi:hypothetical protein
MQHNSMLMANVEIEHAQRQARARAEQRAGGARHNRGTVGALLMRLWRR